MTRGHRSSVIDLEHEILGVSDSFDIAYNGFIHDVLKRAIGSLDLPPGSVGLDLACGPGGVLPILLDAVGPQSKITGVDIAAENLRRARNWVEAKGISAAVDLVRGDLNLPLDFPDAAFDWAWSSDALTPDVCLHPASVILELRRVIRPGGRLGLFFEHAHREVFLPGYPVLEKEIQLVREAGSWAGRPEDHFENAGRWLRVAGLENIHQTPYILLRTQPLDDATKLYCAATLLMYKALVTSEEFGAGPETLALADRILNPESDDYILASPDYSCIVTAVLTSGTVPE